MSKMSKMFMSPILSRRGSSSLMSSPRVSRRLTGADDERDLILPSPTDGEQGGGRGKFEFIRGGTHLTWHATNMTYSTYQYWTVLSATAQTILVDT
jgi:hypothetical protein